MIEWNKKTISKFNFSKLEEVFDVNKVGENKYIQSWTDEIESVFLFQMTYLFSLNNIMNDMKINIEALQSSNYNFYKEFKNIKEGVILDNNQTNIIGDNSFLGYTFNYTPRHDNKSNNFVKINKNNFQLINIEKEGPKVPLWSLWLVWITITFGISILAIVIYQRKDFN